MRFLNIKYEWSYNLGKCPLLLEIEESLRVLKKNFDSESIRETLNVKKWKKDRMKMKKFQENNRNQC